MPRWSRLLLCHDEFLTLDADEAETLVALNHIFLELFLVFALRWKCICRQIYIYEKVGDLIRVVGQDLLNLWDCFYCEFERIRVTVYKGFALFTRLTI